MFEIAMRQLPYAKERNQHVQRGDKGMNRAMLKQISAGLLQPELNGSVCARHRVPGSFKKREFVRVLWSRALILLVG